MSRNKLARLNRVEKTVLALLRSGGADSGGYRSPGGHGLGAVAALTEWAAAHNLEILTKDTPYAGEDELRLLSILAHHQRRTSGYLPGVDPVLSALSWEAGRALVAAGLRMPHMTILRRGFAS